MLFFFSIKSICIYFAICACMFFPLFLPLLSFFSDSLAPLTAFRRLDPRFLGSNQCRIYVQVPLSCFSDSSDVCLCHPRTYDVFAARLHADSAISFDYGIRVCVCCPRYTNERLCRILAHSLQTTLSRFMHGSTVLFVCNMAQERVYISDKILAVPGCFAGMQYQ